MNTMTARDIRTTSLALALLVATVLNGGLLWTFDSQAQQASYQLASQPTPTITLQPVTIIGRLS